MATKIHPSLPFLLNNKGAKLLALVLACLAWFVIQEVISYEDKLTDIPVEIHVSEAGWAVLDKSPQTVSVVFRGPQETIWDMDRDKISIEMNIKASEAAEAKLMTIQTKDVKAPRGVRVVKVEPSQVYFSLDQEGQTNMPVKVTIAGELPVGFEVENVVSKPATVLLYGPRQRLGSIDSVRTAPIDLAGRVRSFEKRVPVVPPSESWGARVEPEDVLVQVTVEERSAQREVSGLKVRAMVTSTTLPGAVTIRPERVNVSVEGRAEVLEGFDPANILAYVDCEGLQGGGTYDMPVKALVPQGLQVKQITPGTVELSIE